MADFEALNYVYPFTVRDRRLRYSALTSGLQTLSVEGPAQRWELDVELDDQVDAGFLASHQDIHGTRTPFLVRMPQLRGADRIIYSQPELRNRQYVDFPSTETVADIPLDSIDARIHKTRANIEWEPPADFVYATDTYRWRFSTLAQVATIDQQAWMNAGNTPDLGQRGLTAGTAYVFQIQHVRTGGVEYSRISQVEFTTVAASVPEPLVRTIGNVGAGASVLRVKRNAADLDVTIKRGLFIRFAGSAKVHRVSETVTVTNAQNGVNLRFYPVLTRPVPTQATVDLDPSILVRWAPQTAFSLEFAPILRPTAYWEEAV